MSAENELFVKLRERFQLFLKLKIRNRLDIDDILQDCLVVIADKYKVEERKENFSGWAYQVLQNKLLAYYRDKQRKIASHESLEESNTVQAVTPDYQLIVNLKDCLKEMHEVNKRYTEVINRYYHGYTADEIVEAMNLTKNSMYILLSRARTMLMTCLKKKKDSQ